MSLQRLPDAWEPVRESHIGARHAERTLELPLTALGLRFEELLPGRRGAPLHWHLAEEEQFYLLSGALTVRELAPDGRHIAYALRAGELVAYPAGTRRAHQFINEGDQPARLLALSTRAAGDVVGDADSGTLWLTGPTGWRRFVPHDAATMPAELLRRSPGGPATAERLRDADRPAHVAGVHNVEPRSLGRGDGSFIGRPLSRIAGAQGAFVNLDVLPPGHHASPLHWHSESEELLVVLGGSATLRTRRGAPIEREGHTEPCFPVPTEERPLVAGSVGCWLPSDRVARQIVAGPQGCSLLVVGSAAPTELLLLPESGQVVVPALGARGRLERGTERAGAAGA